MAAVSTPRPPSSVGCRGAARLPGPSLCAQVHGLKIQAAPVIIRPKLQIAGRRSRRRHGFRNAALQTVAEAAMAACHRRWYGQTAAMLPTLAVSSTVLFGLVLAARTRRRPAACPVEDDGPGCISDAGTSSLSGSRVRIRASRRACPRVASLPDCARAVDKEEGPSTRRRRGNDLRGPHARGLCASAACSSPHPRPSRRLSSCRAPQALAPPGLDRRALEPPRHRAERARSRGRARRTTCRAGDGARCCRRESTAAGHGRARDHDTATAHFWRTLRRTACH